MAVWEEGGVTLNDSTQGAPATRDTIAEVLGVERHQVRVHSPDVKQIAHRRQPSVDLSATDAYIVESRTPVSP